MGGGGKTMGISNRVLGTISFFLLFLLGSYMLLFPKEYICFLFTWLNSKINSESENELYKTNGKQLTIINLGNLCNNAI